MTERLIHNTRVQVNIFPPVNNIPIDQIRSDGNRSVMVISGAASRENDHRYQRTYDAKGTDRTDNCPDGGDPIESFGDPKLSRPEFALGGLVIFLAEDFSDNSLKPRPFTPQLLIFWLLAVFGDCVCFLAVVSMILHFV